MNALTDVTLEPLPLAYGPPDEIPEYVRCPHCGSKEGTWFDRTIWYNGEGKEIGGMANRCCTCGKDVDEIVQNQDTTPLPTPQETFDKVYAEVMATMPVDESEDSGVSSPSPEEKMARIESGKRKRAISDPKRQALRDANRAKGLTSKGTPRKPRQPKILPLIEQLASGAIPYIETQTSSECTSVVIMARRKGVAVAERRGKVYLKENAPARVRKAIV